MKDLDLVFSALVKSDFRRKFHLSGKDLAYLQNKGLDTVLVHAADFVGKRLADAQPKNDGKQTPFRGHPVFVAQHATASCCRGCLEQWHGIGQEVALTAEQSSYIVNVLGRWLAAELERV
jgi:hypothetical protein